VLHLPPGKEILPTCTAGHRSSAFYVNYIVSTQSRPRGAEKAYQRHGGTNAVAAPTSTEALERQRRNLYPAESYCTSGRLALSPTGAATQDREC